MKKLLLLSIIALAVACGKADFSKIEVGMTTAEVKKLVGAPDDKQAFFAGTEMWHYEAGYMIAIQADTVTKVNTMKEMEDTFKDFDKDMEEAFKAWDE